MNSGICQGGPLHGYPNHHPEDSHRLAVDQHSRKAIPGMVASADPYIQFGTYRFADGVWTWHESSPPISTSETPNPVDN